MVWQRCINARNIHKHACCLHCIRRAKKANSKLYRIDTNIQQ